MSIFIEVHGHFSLLEAGETFSLMVNMSDNGRKEYKQPKLNVVMINPAEIIATSPSTGGNIEGGGGLEED